MLNWDNWALPHGLSSDSGLLELRPHTHPHTLIQTHHSRLPATALLHSRKIKLSYLHSEFLRAKFPLTTRHCHVFVLPTLICSSSRIDKGVYWNVFHYHSKVWGRSSTSSINTVKSTRLSRCFVRVALSWRLTAHQTGLFGSVGLWLSLMPPPEKLVHVIVCCVIVLSWL